MVLMSPIYLPAMRNFEGDLAVLLACVHHSPGLVNVRADVRTVQLGNTTVFHTLANHMNNIQRLGFLTNWPVGELLSVIRSCFPNIRALRISKWAVSNNDVEQLRISSALLSRLKNLEELALDGPGDLHINSASIAKLLGANCPTLKELKLNSSIWTVVPTGTSSEERWRPELEPRKYRMGEFPLQWF
ncbi:hypothetical protein B0H14DRAFT_2960840 [Mycena olivaceomarginata]|nr:hypothetical protein B0H14DRAFT_2960840 [Mycena olivaceomarginata]